MLKKIIASSRYIVAAASVGAFIASLLLLIVALAQTVGVVSRAVTNFRAVVADPKELTLVLVTNIDLFLLSAGFYIIALGFYELFVDDDIELPDWLEIHNFDDLKSNLVGIIIVVIAVAFLGQVIDWKGGSDIAYFGLAIGLVTASLTYFITAKGTKKAKRLEREEPPAADQ
jgi:uncharacterized membrane protein YqhA